MPNLPLGQEIYLIGVICAFTVFMVVLAYGRIVTRDRKPTLAPARQAQAHTGHGERHAA